MKLNFIEFYNFFFHFYRLFSVVVNQYHFKATRMYTGNPISSGTKHLKDTHLGAGKEAQSTKQHPQDVAATQQ